MNILDIYLARPSLLMGGLVCVAIAGILLGLGGRGNKIIAVIGGLVALAGAIGMVMSVGGRSAPPLQFVMVCIAVAGAGVTLFSASKLLGKLAGGVIVAVAALALFNSTLLSFEIPFLDRGIGRDVRATFREAEKQVERVFNEAQRRDNVPPRER